MVQPHLAVRLDEQLAELGFGPGWTSAGVRLVSTETPLSTADQAARPLWFTDNRPRVAFSSKAVVKASSNGQSLVGWVPGLPAQFSH